MRDRGTSPSLARPARVDRRERSWWPRGRGWRGWGWGWSRTLRGRGGRARRRHGAVDDPVLPLRRGVARRHLGPQARRAGRVPRAVPADRDDGARRPALRAPADAGPAGPSPGRGQFGGRHGQHQRPPRRLLLQPDRPRPGPELQDARQRPDAPAGRLALHGLRRGLATAAASATCPTRSRCRTGRARPPYTRPGQFAARLGIEHDPLYVHGDVGQPLRFQAPALTLGGEVTAQRLQDRRSLLAAVDAARRDLDRGSPAGQLVEPPAAGLGAAGLLADDRGVRRRRRAGARPRALRPDDQRHEPAPGPPAGRGRRPVRDGLLEGERGDRRQVQERRRLGYARQQLQLPEGEPAAGVRSGLLGPDRRPGRTGLLARTLVLVTSEMGRTPRIGDPRSGGTSARAATTGPIA